jgi:hypothetical protein
MNKYFGTVIILAEGTALINTVWSHYKRDLEEEEEEEEEEEGDPFHASNILSICVLL